MACTNPSAPRRRPSFAWCPIICLACRWSTTTASRGSAATPARTIICWSFLRVPLLLPELPRRAARRYFAQIAEDLFAVRPSWVKERFTDRACETPPAAQAFPEDAAHRTFPPNGNEGLPVQLVSRRRFRGRPSPLRAAFGHYRDQARKRVFEQTSRAEFAALERLLRWLGNRTQDRHLNVLFWLSP